MFKKILATLAGGLLMTSTAYAVPISANSTINFGGQSTCTATTCTFGSAIVTSGSGNFSPFTFGNAATFFTFTYSPFTAEQVYTTTEAGLTTTFSVTSQLSQTSSVVGGLTNITVTDLGIATLTGFDPTPGVYTFTANQNGVVQGSFSATATPVPEPVSLAILGAGLVSLGVARRRARAA